MPYYAGPCNERLLTHGVLSQLKWKRAEQRGAGVTCVSSNYTRNGSAVSNTHG